MKKYTVSLFVLLFSASVISQTKEDYTNTLNLVSKAFNDKKASLIHEKFSSDLRNQIKEVDLKTTLDSLYTEKGKMDTYDLIMDEDKEKNYLVEFENSTMLLLINLTEDGQISLFKIKDY